MKHCLPLLLLACLPFKSNSQSTKAPTPAPTKQVCIDELPARRIAADLAKYPVVLKENHRLREAVKGYEWGYTYQRSALAHKDSALAATGRQLVDERMLHHNAAGTAAVWKAKAKRRWWLIAAEAAVIVLLGGAAAR